MAIETKVYHFEGGRMDGETMRGSNFRLGMEWRSEPNGPGTKVEIYVLESDDVFRFKRYGLDFHFHPDHMAQLDELTAFAQKLSPLLEELDAIHAKYGGPDASPLQIGNWVIRHKDA